MTRRTVDCFLKARKRVEDSTQLTSGYYWTSKIWMIPFQTRFDGTKRYTETLSIQAALAR